MGADFGQLASSEVCRGLWGSGEAAMNDCVQGDQRGQQLILIHSNGDRKQGFINTNSHTNDQENRFLKILLHK